MSNVLTLNEMKNMSIDDIVTMYKNGYIIEENINNLEPTIMSTNITVSTGSLLLIGLGILAYMYIKK